MTQATIDGLAGRAAKAWLLSDALKALRERDNAGEDWGFMPEFRNREHPEGRAASGADLWAAMRWVMAAMGTPHRETLDFLTRVSNHRDLLPPEPSSDPDIAAAWARLDAPERLWRHLLEPGDDPERAERLRTWLVERLGGSDEGEGEAQREAIHKPDGWTRRELIDQANHDDGEGSATLSGTTFDRIRERANIPPALKGGRGVDRRFSKASLRKLIAEAERVSGQKRRRIAERWRELL